MWSARKHEHLPDCDWVYVRDSWITLFKVLLSSPRSCARLVSCAAVSFVVTHSRVQGNGFAGDLCATWSLWIASWVTIFVFNDALICLLTQNTKLVRDAQKAQQKVPTLTLPEDITASIFNSKWVTTVVIVYVACPELFNFRKHSQQNCKSFIWMILNACRKRRGHKPEEGVNSSMMCYTGMCRSTGYGFCF